MPRQLTIDKGEVVASFLWVYQVELIEHMAGVQMGCRICCVWMALIAFLPSCCC
jgi:hypothetical protein